MIETT